MGVSVKDPHHTSLIPREGSDPAGDGADYAPSTYNPRQFLEIGEDFLVGRAFWDKIGDADVYAQLLLISNDVGQELSPLVEGHMD